jgi:phospho-N-acetylmuramoyl-pentapeptide-transferase
MGDVGSLTIGALLFLIAYLLRIEIFYAIMGLLFIIELASTTMQVLSYKLFKRRIFKMAPIHHHFEKCGWSEVTVVRCFWLFSFIVSLIGFLLLFI